MEYNSIRKISTALVIILGVLIFFEALCFLGAGGILNELDAALEEAENLEKKNLFKNPPENLSDHSWVLQKYYNSDGIKRHIKEYEESLSNRVIYFWVIISFFFFSLILRIYFRKNKTKGLSIQ